MNTTRPSLLIRIKDPRDTEAWTQFHDLYAPLIYRYARRRGLPREDAEDVRDQCLEVVARKIADFEYEKAKGGFKNWLYRIASGKVIDLMRKRREKIADSQDIRGLVDPAPSPDEVWEEHWRHEHLKYCVEQVRGLVSPRNFKVFEMLLFDESTVKEVCDQLGLTANQVYKAKSRVLRSVCQVMSELDPDSSV